MAVKVGHNRPGGSPREYVVEGPLNPVNPCKSRTIACPPGFIVVGVAQIANNMLGQGIIPVAHNLLHDNNARPLVFVDVVGCSLCNLRQLDHGAGLNLLLELHPVLSEGPGKLFETLRSFWNQWIGNKAAGTILRVGLRQEQLPYRYHPPAAESPRQ